MTAHAEMRRERELARERAKADELRELLAAATDALRAAGADLALPGLARFRLIRAADRAAAGLLRSWRRSRELRELLAAATDALRAAGADLALPGLARFRLIRAADRAGAGLLRPGDAPD